MEVFKEIEPFRAFLKKHRNAEHSIGFVPTMGALHPGHLELVKRAKAQNSIVVCSIFVNPTQFNNAVDLEKYPRTIDHDFYLLEQVNCDAAFIPEAKEMYPNQNPISFDFRGLDTILEGKYRPGHFSGVGLVVSKLFNIVQPDRVYFGQKDFQQVQIIQKLVKDLNFNVKIEVVSTIRENDGLAMSSRNQRLNHEERLKAIVFFQSLKTARELLLKGTPFSEVKNIVEKKCSDVAGVKLEYFELADVENLNPLKIVEHKTPAVLLIAGYVGEVRLIDNLLIHEN
jgi:pantoate--beta-alanine ligase